MADQTNAPLFGGQGMPEMNNISTDVLGMDEASFLPLPCQCGGLACPACYMTSPISPALHDINTFPHFPTDGSNYPGPTALLYDGHFGGLQTFHLPTKPSRPVLTPQLPSLFINQPPNIANHITNTYAFGDRSTGFVQPNDTLITPVTTAPSLNEEFYDPQRPFDIRDPTGNGRVGLKLAYEPESHNAALELSTLINTSGYRLHGTASLPGQDSGIRALQKALSFNLKKRVPATVEQLNTLLRSVRLEFNGSTDPAQFPLQLFQILNKYGAQSGARFRLGVVTKAELNQQYNTIVYGTSELPLIWLFFDLTGEDTGRPDHWFAIIPTDSNNQGSYAAALTSPAPHVGSAAATSSPVNPSYLHPTYNDRPIRVQRTTPPNRRQSATPRNNPPRNNLQRNNRNPRNPRGPARGRRSGHASREPSEAGTPEHDRPHQCHLCSKGFLYPKDLRRHMTTHTGNKNVKCMLPGCSKTFSRKDNMMRHMRDDHGYNTPTSTIYSV